MWYLFSSLQLELHSREKSVVIIVCFLVHAVEMTKQSGHVQLREVTFIIKFEHSWFHSPLTFVFVIDGKRDNFCTGGEQKCAHFQWCKVSCLPAFKKYLLGLASMCKLQLEVAGFKHQAEVSVPTALQK